MAFERFRVRQLVREEILTYLRDNPKATAADVKDGVEAEITEKYGASPFLELLLQLIPILLPLLLELLKPKTP